jgi:hypothetical protein
MAVTLNLSHQRMNEAMLGVFASGAARHSVGQVLVEHFGEHLPAATTAEKLGFKRAFPHLLEHRPVKGLRDKALALMNELIVLSGRIRATMNVRRRILGW